MTTSTNTPTKPNRRTPSMAPVGGVTWLTREQCCEWIGCELRTYMKLVRSGRIQETWFGPQTPRIDSAEIFKLKNQK